MVTVIVALICLVLGLVIGVLIAIRHMVDEFVVAMAMSGVQENTAKKVLDNISRMYGKEEEEA